MRGRRGASAKALLERQADPDVAVAVTIVLEGRRGLQAVRVEDQPVAVAAGIGNVVEIQRHRASRRRPVFRERANVRIIVEVGVELVGAEKGRAAIVVEAEAVSELAGIAADIGIPLPARIEAAEVALAVRDGIFDARALNLAVNPTSHPLPQPVEGGVDRKVDIFTPSGAEVARRVEGLVVLVED